MALSNREYIGRALEVLSQGLEPHIRRVFAEVAPGLDWPALLAGKDEAAGRAPRTYKSNDVLAQLRIITEKLGTLGWPFGLPRDATAYAGELRQVRNSWAHNEDFSDDDVARAIDTAIRLLRWIRADKAAAELSAIRDDFKNRETTPGTPEQAEVPAVPTAPVPQSPFVPPAAGVPNEERESCGEGKTEGDPADGSGEPARISISLETVAETSYALSYNGSQIISRLSISNPGPEIRGVELKLSLATASGILSRDCVHYLDLPERGSITLASPNLQADPASMLQLEDRQAGTVLAKLVVGADTLTTAEAVIEVLGAQHWRLRPGLLTMESLAAFVQPNHPEIAAVCSEAADILAQRTGSGSLQGYQAGEERADAIAYAIFEAVHRRGIRYSEPPPTWGQGAQRIRTPAQVLDGQFGTCMDTTVVLAAAFEYAGLQPNLWLMEGHIFLGYWRQEANFQTPAVEEPQLLINAVDMERIRLIETTAVTDKDLHPARHLHDAAYARWLTGDLDQVAGVIDIYAARNAGIRPIPARITDPAGRTVIHEYVPPQRAVAPAPHPVADGKKQQDRPAAVVPQRIAQWKNALLDLSLRNRLINFTPTARFPLAVPDDRVGQFEDLVNGGTSIMLLASDAVSAMQAERGIRFGRDLPQEQLADILLNKKSVFADVTEAAYQSRMRNLAYKARTVTEETGANNLYLALGTLVWSQDNKELRSPLILVPVHLRSTGRGGNYTVVLDDTGTSTPNYCLLEKLKLTHNLHIPGLADPAEDASGLDLDAAFASVRGAIAEKGLPFRVEPTVDLSILQFAKYRLWKDLDENWEQFDANPLVRHLIHTPTDAFTDPEQSEPDGDLDNLAAKLPIPADSSQLQAVAEAVAGKTFVLEGPPGTGKSQTITNLLTRAVAEGKRVLFVAEKRAALDVVQKRLNDVGMGVFTLDLHDKGSKPAAVREQIRRALEHSVDVDDQGLRVSRSELSKAQRELRRYAFRLHQENPAELSFYGARTQELAVGSDVPALPVPDAFLAATDLDQLQQLRSVLADLPDDAEPALPGPDTPWGFLDKALSDQKLAKLAAASTAFDTALKTLAAVPGLQPVLHAVRTPQEFARLVPALQLQDVDVDLLDEVNTERWQGYADQLGRSMSAFLAASHPGLDKATPQALDLPLADIHAQAVAAAESGFFGRKKRLLAVLEHLSGVLRPDAQVRPKEVPALTEALLQVQAAVRGLAGEASSLPGVALPASWNPLTEPGQEHLRRSVEWLKRTAELVRLGGTAAPEEFLPALRAFLRQRVPVPAEAVAAAQVLADAAADLFAPSVVTKTELAVWRGEHALLARWQQTAPGRGTVPDAAPSLRRRIRFLAALEPLRAVGLTEARAQLLLGQVDAEDAVAAFELGLAVASRRERAAATGLREFEPRRHEKAIERFLTRSAAVRAQLRDAIPAEVLAARPFNPRSDAGQMGKLHRQLSLKRGMRVRPLMEAFGELIVQITPCVLVSPDSVARFFPARSDLFDLVVFDEASQIRVADAVGAMGRGRSVVVVGDSKQMPPTSVAEAAVTDRDEDAELAEETVEDEESILSECVLARVPRHWLTWHYRSQDEALIAFSNQQYYDAKLSSFPAPVHGPASPGAGGYGVSFVRVEGQFQRSGKGKLLRTNPVEAEAVVAEIRRRFDASPASFPSLGVVTFNLQQRAYIETLLRDCDDPRIAEALEAPEGLFVKNLENVQGDERDTILFSTGFSKNEKGVLPLNFGPLTRSGGERRLNVAVTRARRQVVVFSSFDPADIRTAETSSVGLKHLRSYLELAAAGTGALPADGRRRPAVDRHREQIAAVLRQRGLVVNTDVGLSDFKVDLSVALPEDPERPLMAILLDSPAWAARGTVGDRDGLPSDVLSRMLRWPAVQRVWLPEWVADAEAVADRLEKEIRREDLLEVAEDEPDVVGLDLVAASVPEGPVDETAGVRTVPAPVSAKESNGRPYLQWSYRGAGGTDYLDKLSSSPRARETVRAVLESIVEAEGPIHITRLAKLVCAEFDLINMHKQRAASVLKLINREKLHVDNDEFVWPTSLAPTTWLGFRYCDESAARKIEQISLVEIGNAMAELCRNSAGLEPEDLRKQVVRVFGIRRRTTNIRQRLDAALEAALDANKISLSGSGQVVATAPKIVTRTTQLDRPLSGTAAEAEGASWTEESSRRVLELYHRGLMVRDIAVQSRLDQFEVAAHLINELLTPTGDITDETGADRHGKPYLQAELRRMAELYRRGDSLSRIAKDLGRTQLGVGWRVLDEGLPRSRS
ncbi:DUF4011 domain-containing protein [Arthrobacter citreus]|uniref:DUF4011 domain-containing protein n=1 Tax=Arthrobacter citreus TaxID=1670 RepID=UPI0037F97FDD